MSIPHVATDIKVRAGFIKGQLDGTSGYFLGKLFGFDR